MPDVNLQSQWTDTGDDARLGSQFGAAYSGNGGGSTPEPIGQTIQFEAIVTGSITFTAIGIDEDET